jgi:SAM-dependent methyltransferase
VPDARGFVESEALGALGAQLRGAGLTPRALAAWAGTARIAALPARLDEMPAGAQTPAAALLALLVAGAELSRDRLRALPDAAIDALLAHGLIERVAEDAGGDAGEHAAAPAGGPASEQAAGPASARLRARVALVPLGAGVLVCDRLDAPIERALVCWPDDSSHHLATAIPSGRRDSWLDLGCGSAFAALARPELARRISGVDLNERAVRYARAGAALSGLRHLEVRAGDIGDPCEPADLVTCNAPMPGLPGDPRRTAALPELWRHADPGFFARLWPALARAVRPGGMIVVHGAADAVLPVLADAPGERVAVIYTPERTAGFAVAWWRPDAPARRAIARRALTPARPHVDPQDREDALAH